jgi:hypothetical protein
MAERRKISPEENIPPVTDLMSVGIKHAEKRRNEAKLALENARRGIRVAREHLAGQRARDTRRRWTARLRDSAADASQARAKYRHNNGPVLAGGRGKLLGEGADAVGAAATFAAQLDESTATTFTGKVVDGALAGTGDVILGKTPVAAADAVVQLGLQAVGVDPKGWTVGDNVNTGFRALVTSAEAGITGNYSGVATFDEKARSGGYGPPAQVLGHFGADIGKDGLGATVVANVAYYWHYAVGR